VGLGWGGRVGPAGLAVRPAARSSRDPEKQILITVCAVRDMLHTCSRRVGSANRNCTGIDFRIPNQFSLNREASKKQFPISSLRKGEFSCLPPEIQGSSPDVKTKI